MAGACWLLWRLHLMCVIFRNILLLITDTQQIILIILHIIFIHSEVEGLFLSHTLCRTFRPKCNINKHFGGSFVLTCSLRPSTPLFGTNLIFHVWRSNVNIWHYLITNRDGITKLTIGLPKSSCRNSTFSEQQFGDSRNVKHAHSMREIGVITPIMVLLLPRNSKSQRIDHRLRWSCMPGYQSGFGESCCI